LRNDPRIPISTCERIQQIAREMGYRPDPEISSCLKVLRRRHECKYVETLAYLSLIQPPVEKSASQYGRQIFLGAKARAEELGYHLDELWIRAPGMTRKRLDQILKSRSIRACLLPSLFEETEFFPIDWNRYCVAAMTCSFPDLPLHRSLPSIFRNTFLAFTEVLKLGYRRIGLLLDEYINVRIGYHIQSSYLNMQYLHPELDPLPIFHVPSMSPVFPAEKPAGSEAERFRKWVRENRPEVILASRSAFHFWIETLGMSCPEEIGFVSLEGVEDNEPYTHIDQKPFEIGAAGVDVVVSLLNRNRKGFAHNPSFVCTVGEWVRGTTVRDLTGGNS